jgi:ketopantoate reductase
MRYVIVGLGGIGGTLAGLLHETGSDVVGVARAGPHLDALKHQSMTVRA